MPNVQLILVDGMRPDALAASQSPDASWLLENSLYTLKARTVVPSVTLPCHMSLFHSVDPARHGVTTNLYTPQVRPISGLLEQLKGTKRCGLFYNWEELRDLSRPDSACCSLFFAGHTYGYEAANRMVAQASMQCLKVLELDFTFTYLGWTDAAGHDFGWMSEEYLRSVCCSLRTIREMIEAAGDDCVTIVTADHGGHDRTHGSERPEDMLIPVFLHGVGQKGELDRDVSIKDIAPTIVRLLGSSAAPEWEGRSLL